MEAYTGRGLYSNHRPKNNAPEKFSPPKFEDRKPQITPKSVKELTTIHFDKPKGIFNKTKKSPTKKISKTAVVNRTLQNYFSPNG